MLKSIRKAAGEFWDGVEKYRKWDKTDLKSTELRSLSYNAEKIVEEFMVGNKDDLKQNPLNWLARVIAANSMYRISKTILLPLRYDEHLDDDVLFESISIQISDILAACLTNLVQVITLKCHTNNIKEMEESVRRAAILLGETKTILEIVQQQFKLPSLDVERAAKIGVEEALDIV